MHNTIFKTNLLFAGISYFSDSCIILIMF